MGVSDWELGIVFGAGDEGEGVWFAVAAADALAESSCELFGTVRKHVSPWVLGFWGLGWRNGRDSLVACSRGEEVVDGREPVGSSIVFC